MITITVLMRDRNIYYIMIARISVLVINKVITMPPSKVPITATKDMIMPMMKH